MDDVQDILDSVSAPAIHPRTLDLLALTRAWINERTSPALLPFPTRLMDAVMGRVRQQIATIEDIAGAMDPKSNFDLVVLHTELERVKFLVRSYLRARIGKIDKYPLHTRQLFAADPSMLSGLEMQYLQQHQALLSSHFHSAFLSSFPAQLQRLDDSSGSGGASTMDRPDEDTAVFARVLRDAGEVEVYGEAGTADVELRRGDVWILRWSAIKDMVVRGDVELL